MPVTNLSAAIEGSTAWVRIVGRACAERAKDFGGAVELFRSQGVKDVVLELGECRLMDSTFSGVLTGLIESTSETKIDFTLVNPTERVTDLLDNLGVLNLVKLVSCDSVANRGASWEIERGSHSQEENAACCLKAHQLLMGLKPENQARFADLTRMLEENLRQTQVGSGA